MMQRRSVQSSNVASIGWEADGQEATGTLEIEFHSGHLYQYDDVPEQVYLDAVGASSVGRFVNRYVVGVFDERRIN